MWSYHIITTFSQYWDVLYCLSVHIHLKRWTQLKQKCFYCMDGLFIFYCLCLAISPLTNQLSAFLLLLLLLYQKALPALNNRLVTWSYTPVTIFFLSSRIVCLGSFHRMLLNSASASARSNWNFTQRTNHHFSLMILWHAPKVARLHGNSSGSCFRVCRKRWPTSQRHPPPLFKPNKEQGLTSNHVM